MPDYDFIYSEELNLSQEIYFGFTPLEIKTLFTNGLDESHLFPGIRI